MGTTGGLLNPFVPNVNFGLTGNITLTVLDISDPQHPAILGNTRITENHPNLDQTYQSKLVVSDLGNGLFAVSDTTRNGSPAILLVDPGDPSNIAVGTVAASPTSGVTVSGGFLYAARTDGLAVYQIGQVLGEPVTVSVQVPNNAGVSVDTSSFNQAPDQTISGTIFTTYVWSRIFGSGTTDLTFSWQAALTGIQAGVSINTTLGATVQYSFQGTAGTLNLPATSATGIAVPTTLIDTVAPVVSMTAPASGSTLDESKPTLSAIASDNSGGSGLASVQFQHSSDGGTTWNNAGAAESSAPFNFTFATALANGSYVARAIAADNAGNSAISTPVSFTILATPLSVVMTAPVNGSATHNNEPTLAATVTVNSGPGIGSVQFQFSSDGGTFWNNAGAPETSGPFSFTFTTALPDGTYEARAIATDNAANDITSSPVFFIIDTIAPTVTMTVPANGKYLNNNKPALAAIASDIGDGSGLATVQFQYSTDAGATWNNADTPEISGPFSFTFTSALADGTYGARAIATDGAGNSTISPAISFSIDTVAPAVSMTAPANGLATSNNEPTLSATASDNSSGSGVASVQFQYSSDGGATWSNAGSPETAAPFSFTFTTALVKGTYQARASGIDNAGNCTTSTAVFFGISIVQASPTLSDSPGGTAVLGSGGKLTDSATLSKGSNPTGTITFTLYAPDGKTGVYSEKVTVTGNGTYTTPNGLVPSKAGTCQWTASYSGDSSNKGVSSVSKRRRRSWSAREPPWSAKTCTSWVAPATTSSRSCLPARARRAAPALP